MVFWKQLMVYKVNKTNKPMKKFKNFKKKSICWNNRKSECWMSWRWKKISEGLLTNSGDASFSKSKRCAPFNRLYKPTLIQQPLLCLHETPNLRKASISKEPNLLSTITKRHPRLIHLKCFNGSLFPHSWKLYTSRAKIPFSMTTQQLWPRIPWYRL